MSFTPARPTPGALAAPLLYWLLVICGLVGMTVVRFDTDADLSPLWCGTVAGVAAGQLLAFLRVRPWLPIAFAIGGISFLAPILFAICYQIFGAKLEPGLIAFLPAAVCGYLSLSERAGLIAFWYPAVLWMLVILDGPSSDTVLSESTLPFAIGLGVLFVAFLRARQTRRVALWRTYARVRLAEPRSPTVLRSSPLRAAGQVAWTGLVGTAAFVLAAWIAPQLWQREQANRAAYVLAHAGHAGSGVGTAGDPGERCCPIYQPKRERVREYFPLLHDIDGSEPDHDLSMSCVSCPANGARRYESGGVHDSAYGSLVGTRAGYGVSFADPTSAPAYGYGYIAPSVTPEPDPIPKIVIPEPPANVVATPKPVVPPQPHHAHPPRLPAASPSAQPAAVAAAVAPSTPPPPRPAAFVPKPSGPRPEPVEPWLFTLELCAFGLAMHLVTRALRRRLTLRHLTRPFWDERLDQRISNHWQRMLIGLRDAGIQPAQGEQPAAFARRAGFEGMPICATILERVRHGVRVDDVDLEQMSAAAGAVYRAARQKAGAVGRATAWLRWPLA